MAQTYRGQQDKRFAPDVGYTNKPKSIFAGADPKSNTNYFTTRPTSRFAPQVQSQSLAALERDPKYGVGVGSLSSFVDQMKNITPGMLQSPSGSPAPKAKATTAKKTTPSRTAVARRITGGGVAAPVAKPIDPLEALRGEYDKYMQDIYGGLTTSLEAERQQYKTRSDELAARLGATYDDAAKVAGGVSDASQNALAEFAKRMGLESTTQGQAVQDWQATNERLKALNATNRASSMGTNDLIRSNYYDFLRDKIASAEGNMATSRAGINDIILQAQLARQQAAQAAAAAAARARSSRRRGGGGGSSGKSGVTGTTTEKTSSSNDAQFQLALNNPDYLDALISGDTAASAVLAKGNQPYRSPGFGVPGSAAAQKMASDYAAAAARQKQAQDLAKAIVLATRAGGPKTSSTYTTTSKQKNI